MKAAAFVLLASVALTLGSINAERRGRHKGGDTVSTTEDFEFEEEIQAHRRQGKILRIQEGGEGAPSNGRPQKLSRSTSVDSELCLALRCSHEEHCQVKNENVALCVANKKPTRDRKLAPFLPTPNSLTLNLDKEDNDESDNDDDDEDDSDDDVSDYEDESAERRPPTSTGDDSVTPGMSEKASHCATCPVAKPSFVCGSDNKTYSSPCRIHYHNCVHRAAIKMLCKGFCPCPDAKVKESSQRWNHFVNKYKLTIQDPPLPKEQKQKDEQTGSSVTLLVKTGSSTTNNSLAAIPSQSNYKTHKGGIVPLSKIEFIRPQDIKYKNMIDKYGKMEGKIGGNHNPPYAEDKQRQKGHNSVLSEKVDNGRLTPATDQSACNPRDLEVMESRLLGWFSVVMAEDKQQKRPYPVLRKMPTFPDHCQSEVQWIFTHMDLDQDGRLALKELSDLEQDAREHCIKPFLEHCDNNQDSVLTPAEWCACFDPTERPCLTAKSRSKSGFLGSYVPSCDEDGYYQRTQCHGSVGLCWCVDKHGVEYANTRMKGRPDCDSIVGQENSEDEDDTDEDSMMEGSADQPLDI